MQCILTMNIIWHYKKNGQTSHETHGGTIYAHYWVKRRQVQKSTVLTWKSYSTIWFQLHDILETTKLWMTLGRDGVVRSRGKGGCLWKAQSIFNAVEVLHGFTIMDKPLLIYSKRITVQTHTRYTKSNPNIYCGHWVSAICMFHNWNNVSMPLWWNWPQLRSPCVGE